MAEPQQQGYYNLTDTQSQTHKDVPSASKILLLLILLLLGGTLFVIAGVTLTATVLGLTVTAPLFVIFSPVLIPATLVIGLAVAGFLTSGAFGVTSLSSFASMANYLRRSRLPEQLQHAKARAQESMGRVAQRVEEGVDTVESKVQQAQNKAGKATSGENQTESSA